MKLNERSYPHPVLGNKDDVPGVAFQATLEMSADKQFVYLNTEVSCSCAYINSLIVAEKAHFVLHVECGNTLFRKAYEFNDPKYRVSIPADNLNDAVEVNVFVCAKSDILGYRIPEAHPDYEETSFDIGHGDILAIGEGRIFYIDSDFDALSRIGSIMQISESPQDGDIPMDVSFDEEKIIIWLSKKDFADYKTLKLNEAVRGPLTTTIVLPVLIEALRLIADESAEYDDDKRWVRALKQRIKKVGETTNKQPLFLAQKLLELPVKRALSSARTLAEASSQGDY